MSTHGETLERFQEYLTAERDNREEALSDLQFRAGQQWSDIDANDRRAKQRPMLTVNRMGQFVRNVTGPLRRSAPSIQPLPVDDNTDEFLTKIFAGLIRQIEYQSNASAVYAWGAECQVACGIGHWQIATKYADEGFDQDICIKRIVDPLAVVWDCNAVELDRSDAYECFVTEWLSKQAYEREFKDGVLPSDFPAHDLSTESAAQHWRSGDKVRIASRWFKSPVKRRLGMTQDGRIFDITKIDRDRAVALGVVRDRQVDDFEVKHERLSGDDMLSEPEKWAGRHIPVVPVIGEEIPLDGSVVRHGIIRYAKDPQRLYNYWRSAAAEMIGSAPKSPFLVTLKMIAGLEGYWKGANVDNLPYLPFNPDPQFPGLTPKRQEPPTPPTALWQEANIAQDDMKATTGVYDAALGSKSNEISRVAIDARVAQTADGSFVYFDNFNHAIRRTGQVLLDLIPKIYDGERVVRILGDDDAMEFVKINQMTQGIDGPVLVNDVTAAKFDVRIKTGPSYSSARDEAKQQLAQIISAAPGLMNVIGDLYFENMDFPGAKQLAERMKKTLPPQLTGDGQEQPPPQDPVAEAMQRASMHGAEADVRLKQAKADSAVLDNQAKFETITSPHYQAGPPPPSGPPVR